MSKQDYIDLMSGIQGSESFRRRVMGQFPAESPVLITPPEETHKPRKQLWPKLATMGALAAAAVLAFALWPFGKDGAFWWQTDPANSSKYDFEIYSAWTFEPLSTKPYHERLGGISFETKSVDGQEVSYIAAGSSYLPGLYVDDDTIAWVKYESSNGYLQYDLFTPPPASLQLKWRRIDVSLPATGVADPAHPTQQELTALLVGAQRAGKLDPMLETDDEEQLARLRNQPLDFNRIPFVARQDETQRDMLNITLYNLQRLPWQDGSTVFADPSADEVVNVLWRPSQTAIAKQNESYQVDTIDLSALSDQITVTACFKDGHFSTRTIFFDYSSGWLQISTD